SPAERRGRGRSPYFTAGCPRWRAPRALMGLGDVGEGRHSGRGAAKSPGGHAMLKTPISADSHITEPPNCYVDYIDPKFRERAPRVHRHDKIGDVFQIEGLSTPVPLGLLAAAGKE